MKKMKNKDVRRPKQKWSTPTFEIFKHILGNMLLDCVTFLRV